MTNELAHQFVSDTSVSSQEFRTLRNNLSLQTSRHDVSVLLITSATAGEGKSYVAANLAASFAVEGKRTLLVEGNLHRPILAAVFDLQPNKGLSSLVGADAASVKADDLIIETKIQKLTVAPAGESLADPATLLAGSAFKAFLDQVKDKFDVVLIDGPAMADASEAGLIAELANGVVVVAKADGPSKRDVAQTIAQVRQLPAALIGTVLNQA
ncbi:CpsD/CapB family tyrosine-protein kinase [Lacticaseibacillus parahuelsenbergensis]|uniref:Tyrosine-protein kinase CpsD n=1 Tax=Lacticaseibacillus parahuelsenbergensis TaxID=3068305 RepID=A0ABY9L072_9LACO|nr:CpsD/CapB family tyrosine-protein kinase [Lacticaseibacillus sp. NCIMB 15471]WLV77091.1 CpsD/CapB family tyrosine-protein kinase [Lacticaseibacillus sp. NCIMB 15471]